MKEILEKIFDKKINYFYYKQPISVNPKQDEDKDIYETEVYTEEPSYHIQFLDGSESVIELNELIIKIFNSK